MRVAAGTTFSSFLFGATESLVNHYGFQLVNFADDTVVIARTTTGVEEIGDGVYQYTGSAPDDLGVYFFRWDDGVDAEPYFDDRSELLEVVTGSVTVDGQPTFATRADIELRLGRDLTTRESDQVDLLLVLGTGAIAEACDKDTDWAAGLTVIPNVLRIICMELVVRVLLNPAGLKSGSESLGAYSKSGTYASSGVFGLTDLEERLARRAVHGSNSGSSRPLSSVDEVYDFLYS